MIEELPLVDKEKAEEYIYLLHSKQNLFSPRQIESDAKYREYILQGIQEGEEDFVNGDILDSEEAKQYLEELLKKGDIQKIILKILLNPINPGSDNPTFQLMKRLNQNRSINCITDADKFTHHFFEHFEGQGLCSVT